MGLKRNSKQSVSVSARLMALPPQGMRGLMGAYLESLAVKNYSPASVEDRAQCLSAFATWCEERSLSQLADVTRPILERYQRHLFLYRKKNGRPLGASTQYQRLMVLKGFFRWLVRQNHLLSNPASELELPRTEKRLPAAVLSASETEQVLQVPDVKTAAGLRDRAMLEVLYSTGVRRKELCGLRVLDVNFSRSTLMVRQGKGKKDRLIPIGARALSWVEKYLAEARPLLVVEPDAGVLFLNSLGESFLPSKLSDIVSAYVTSSGVAAKGACHLFRHTMATLMLENGADIRFVQEMLGHASLQSTQLYTRVSIRKLQQIHEATHPAAKLERTAPATAVDDELAAELLSSLAAEADDENDEPD